MVSTRTGTSTPSRRSATDNSVHRWLIYARSVLGSHASHKGVPVARLGSLPFYLPFPLTILNQ